MATSGEPENVAPEEAEGEPVPAEAQDEVSVDEALEASGDESADVSAARPSALDNDGANAIAADRRTTGVVLAGEVDSGKTSIYAAMYERFGRGPFAGRWFAGSQTLAGLEKRCHTWRVESGRPAPVMEHTRRTDLPWLHLQMKEEETSGPIQDLLLGDFDGEVFTELVNGTQSGAELKFLRRADHVGVILDGDRLSKATERQAAFEQAKYLVDALLKPDTLASPHALFVVLTKLDLVVSRGPEELAAAEEVVAQVTRRIETAADLEASVRVLRVAARSQTEQFPLGHGINELLDLVSARPALHAAHEPPQPDLGSSWFARFQG